MSGMRSCRKRCSCASVALGGSPSAIMTVWALSREREANLMAVNRCCCILRTPWAEG